jgi:hypothetical protein
MTMSTTPDTTQVRPGAYLFFTTGQRADVRVIDTPQELLPGDGQQVIEFPSTGVRQFIQATGRAVSQGYDRCPTFNRYEVLTVVIDGAIWGVPGPRITGTLGAFPGSVLS